MYPPPGPELSDATVAELDDQFFTSDPFAYIRSRILRLLSADPPSLEGPAADEFTRLLGPSAAAYRSSDGRASTLQVAVDAFALRHQVAETLLRFLHVVLHHESGRSHWVELVDTPMKMLDVLRENRVVFDAQEDNGARMMRDALVPPITAGTVYSAGPPLTGRANPETASSAPVSSDEVDRALDLFIQWINYAIVLMTQQSGSSQFGV